MFRRTLGITTLALASAAAPTRADIMHWFWEVEVNGQAVDAQRPIVVTPQDQVDIELWAEFDPHRDGFAGAGFAISTGDTLFESGDVLHTLDDGYGLNPYLSAFGQNGFLADEDGSGSFDRIDDIVAFQLHPEWGVGFDRSNPILVYSMGWNVLLPIAERFRIAQVPTLDGHFGGGVWVDAYTTLDYPMQSEVLIIVPCPSVLFIVGGALLGAGRRVSISRNLVQEGLHAL